MPNGEHPIDIYLSQLAQRLLLPATERDQVLAEVRGHLEERALLASYVGWWWRERSASALGRVQAA